MRHLDDIRMPRDVPASPMTLRPGGLKTSLFCSIVAAGIMVAVKKTLERDDGKCFKTIRSVGVKLLNSAETVEVIDGNISRIGRIAKSGLQTLSTVNYNELTDQEKTDFNRKSGVLGVMKMSAMPKTQNKIEHYFKMGTIDNTKVLEALMAASSK